jgi:hypothetical protein
MEHARIPFDQASRKSLQVQRRLLYRWDIRAIVPLSQWRSIEAAGNERKLLVHADNVRPHTAKLSTQSFNENRMKSAPHPLYSIPSWSRAVGLLSVRACQEMYRRLLIRGCRLAFCSSRRCSREYWKSDLASSLSRVDGPIKEMHRYQWGVYWGGSNKG